MRVATLVFVSFLIVGRPAAGAEPWRGGTDVSPAGIAIADGHVYVADFDHDRILVFTLDGTAAGGWGASGAGAGALHGPAGIAAAAGVVVVADLDNHRLQTFSATGMPLAVWNLGDARAAPCGVALAANGRVFATDLDAGVVRVWTAPGTPAGTWSGPPTAPLIEPWGIAVAPDGVVWVADHANDRIVRFAADGAWLGAWGVAGIADGQLLGPMGLAAASDGSLLVTDRAGARVQRFDAAGHLLDVVRLAPASGANVLLASLATDGATTLVGDVGGGTILPVAAGTAAAPVPPGARTAAFALIGVTPSPSRGPVTLRWSVPARGTLTAGVYALDGRHVATLGPVACDPGERAIAWAARTAAGAPAPPGVYFVHVTLDQDGGASLTRDARVVLVR